QDFVLLLQQASPPPQLPQFSGFVGGIAGLVTSIDLGLAEPFRDGAFVDAEVLGDLSDRGLLVAVQGHADDVIAELFRVGLRHGVYPSRLACVQARSDVTKPCISPSPYLQGVPGFPRLAKRRG